MENFTPQQSLELISQVIRDAKQRFEENGLVYMVWGSLISVLAFAQFLLLQSTWANFHFVPYFLMPLGNLFSWFYYRKQTQQNNLVSKSLKMLWLAISINIYALSFVFFGHLGANLIPLILLLAGIGMVVSGFSLTSDLLKISGCLVNLSGFACFWVDLPYQPLHLSITSFVCYFLAGAYLYFKKRNA